MARPSWRSVDWFATLLVGILVLLPTLALAQEVTPTDEEDEGPAKESYVNTTAGEFTPARGFDIIKTDHGSLNISVYGLFRYLNQMPGEQSFTDHLGNERKVNARNDMYWHRSMVWLSGFFYKPQLRYTITVWSLPTTQQALVFGFMTYTASKAVTFGAGIAPNLTIRSMQGSWPFWAGSDRQMAEEGLRGGFSPGFFVTGQPIDRFFYTVSMNTNLSVLGVTPTNDTRDMSYSASVSWMPTTGEFGPRGGFGDLEDHQKLATRFGMSAAHAREGRYAPNDQPPNETQIRLSDSVSPYETGALAAGVTVEELDYDILAFDAGFKIHGFSFQTEYSMRSLSNFAATGPLPDDSIVDHAIFAEAMQMVVPKKLGIYAVTSYFWDQFERHPWEVGGGASFYPTGTRSWRLNLHILHVEKSPASSNFGYYTGGQTGTILSLGTDILL